MDIKGKNIILTGASAGIGSELLKKLSTFDGVKVIGVARHTDNIQSVPDKIYTFPADMSNKEGVDSLFEYAGKTLGHIDIFIANAGFGFLEKLDKPDWQHIESIFSLNVFSPVYSLEKFVQQGNGLPFMFVSTVSGAGLVSLPGYSLYCSTKAALHHFIQTYRFENKDNLKLMGVYPVATRTAFFDKASQEHGTPMPWPVQTTETVARKIINGILKDKKTVYPSLLFRLSYPLGRAFPFLLKIYSLIEKRKVKNWLEGK